MKKVLMTIAIVILIIIFNLLLLSCGIEATTTTISKTTTTANTTIDNSNVKYGLTEAQRKQAYYDLAVLQDSIAVEDPPNRSEKMTEAYSIIAKKYDITKDEMLEITAEGMGKNWPVPPVE